MKKIDLTNLIKNSKPSKWIEKASVRLKKRPAMNEFETIVEAIETFNTNPIWNKAYWDSFNESSACVIAEKGKYWIITHPTCVRYREKKGQIVAYLN